MALKSDLHEALETLYNRYNRPRYIHPDPLEFVYRYDHPRDREVAGFIAAAFAYGRVAQILSTIESVLEPMGASPSSFVTGTRRRGLVRLFRDVRHRWTTPEELAACLVGMGRVLRKYGSLEACFKEGSSTGEGDVTGGLCRLISGIKGPSNSERNSLLPDPSGGSACKRLYLFLRWMIRRDRVDPGCWQGVSASRLIVPVDTHMHRIGRALKLTRRKQANLATAKEITQAFRRMVPEDPVRYDFALTRLGIRADTDPASFLSAAGIRGRS